MQAAEQLPVNKVDAAVLRFDDGGFVPGDLVSHDWIKWALDIPEPRTLSEARESQWVLLARVEEFKYALLKERKLALETVRGRGYRVVPPEEQAEFATRTTMGYIRKGLHKGGQLLRNARTDQMSDTARRRHADVNAKMDSFRRMVKRERRNVFELFER